MTAKTRKSNSKVTTDDLFERALEESHKDSESDERWELVRELRERDINVVFARAEKYCKSDDWVERELGADLLCLGMHESKSYVFPKKSETRPILEQLLEDHRPEVIASAIYVVKHLNLSRELLDERTDLATHTSVFIRRAMSSSIDTLEPTDNAIKMLLLLMTDKDGDVRDWATFSIGVQSDIDNPELREALFARLNDPHDDTHCEAVVGLARRGDTRALPAIKERFEEELQQDEWDLGHAWIEAAAEIASPELLPYLESKIVGGKIDVTLDRAIRRCRGELSPDGVVYGLQPDAKN